MAGGIVTAVAPGSAGQKAGLAAGDLITHVGGEPLADLIDWLWHTSEDTPVEWLRDGARFEATLRAVSGGPGVEIAGVVFDAVRTCENACSFCFVDGLPSGLRPSLYVRDDDYRLSFLTGSFITLTNLTDCDMARITERRLSPLYVSLHAVDARVRRQMLCPTVADEALATLDTLLEDGIEAHVQIVVVPGVNDGGVLEETLRWVEDRPGIRSVGVVPVGLTAFGGARVRELDGEVAEQVLTLLDGVRDRRESEGRSLLVHGADELYLRAGRDLPSSDRYEGFPQYENGIGLVRAFIDEFDSGLSSRAAVADRRVTLVTGESFGPVLAEQARALESIGVRATVLAVRNDFFGGGVSVAGLLTGRDLVATIGEDEAAGPYLVPDILFNDDGVTLDDMTAEQVASASGKDVEVVPTDAAGLIGALVGAPGREDPGA